MRFSHLPASQVMSDTAFATDKSSVLPPPPRYPAGAYGIGLGGVVPLIETNNTLSNPSGPEYQFLVGEGKSDMLRLCRFGVCS